jgi:hypothetical protein
MWTLFLKHGTYSKSAILEHLKTNNAKAISKGTPLVSMSPNNGSKFNSQSPNENAMQTERVSSFVLWLFNGLLIPLIRVSKVPNFKHVSRKKIDLRTL